MILSTQDLTEEHRGKFHQDIKVIVREVPGQVGCSCDDRLLLQYPTRLLPMSHSRKSYKRIVVHKSFCIKPDVRSHKELEAFGWSQSWIFLSDYGNPIE